MLFKYVGAENGSQALSLLKHFCEKYTLKASNPTSFNDPFEFKFTVDFEADEGTIMERYFQNKPNSSEDEYESWRRHHTKYEWFLVQETRKELLSRFGVCCLSEVEDNHLMWSHYASEHQGFCVGFDEASLETIDGVTGHGPVEYREIAPRFSYYADISCQTSGEDLIRYESSTRLVKHH